VLCTLGGRESRDRAVWPLCPREMVLPGAQGPLAEVFTALYLSGYLIQPAPRGSRSPFKHRRAAGWWAKGGLGVR
jgi:hypothetical protein